MKSWLEEIATSKLLTLFEPEKEVLPNVRIGQARHIATRIAQSSGNSFIAFPNRYGRHTTLAGIWMFLERDHEREYLITTFGQRSGQGLSRPAQFSGLHIAIGDTGRVNFSPRCIDYLQKHVEAVANAEVLICHNHPRNGVTEILSQLMDWSPLPSNTDRRTMSHLKHASIVKWLDTGDFRNLRFFLVEHGRLREFLLPPATDILNVLRKLRESYNHQD
ncbi:MAG: hypothetical protein MOB07_30650 [Acidobacteria bacterium]|nr:hypothetical protein [Acidobacteriota bacterium]